ncbi:MAG: hypothetical protein A2314_07750 [Elusimicrobia bacterium RIFOXYB2_FULL_50_12]|nr:MAG: hypothetical protein A2314_07750 [Elusimicrobia bacterium RIFOXYB2_FULL_50_12]
MVLTLSAHLLQRGVDVQIANLCDGRSGSRVILRSAERAGIGVHEITCLGRADITAVRSLADFVRKGNFSIIHSHGYKPDIYAYAASGKGIARIATCHNWPGRGAKMSFYRWLDKMALRYFDRVAAVSGGVKNEAERSGINRFRLCTIHNGVDFANFARVSADDVKRCRSALAIKDKVKLVLAVGRLAPEKGYSYLIEAAARVVARHPGAVFAILGDGTQKDVLEAQIKKAGLENNFRLPGQSDEVNFFLAAADVFVMPSINEGMPMALLEAMAAGKPIVASRVGEIPAILDDGVSGWLVPPADSHVLSEKIISFLETPKLAQILARNGRQTALARFSAGAMADEYIKLYKAASWK